MFIWINFNSNSYDIIIEIGYKGVDFMAFLNDIDRVCELVDLISKNTEEKWSSEKLEKELHTSSTHLRRLFKNCSTLSLGKYIERLRLNDAVDYIMSGNSLKAAAIKYDFTEPGLSNTFKIEFGITISEYKKQKSFVNLNKNMDIGIGVKKIGRYQHEFEKLMFVDILEIFDNNNMLDGILMNGDKNALNLECILKLNLEKIIKYIDLIGKKIYVKDISMGKLIYSNSTLIFLY